MKHLFSKEISMFFSSVMGYLVITVFLLLTGLFLFVFPSDYNLLDFGYATLDAFFSMAPMVFLFLIPAITMRSFSEERRTGTLEILMTKPLSDFQLVLAKYWACIVLLILALIPTATYVHVIQQLSQPKGNVDMGGIWGSYFGLLFIGGAFTAIGIFLSSVSKNQIVAFILSVVVCGFMLFGFDLMGGFFGRGEVFVQDLGMNVHYASMSRGAIDLRDVAYFLGIIAIFVALTLNRLQKQKKSSTKRMLFLGHVLLWVIALNFAVSFVFLRLDLTSEKRYTLHPNTKQLVKKLDHTVYFKIYLDGDLPADFKRLKNATREMLEEFSALNDKVQFELVNLDLKTEKERTEIAVELGRKGIFATTVMMREKGGMSQKGIYPVAEVSFQGKNEVVDLLQPQAGLAREEALNYSVQMLEYQLTSTIYKLTLKENKSVRFIDGHGELDVFQTYDAMLALSGFYDVERLRMDQDPAKLLQFSEETGEIKPIYDAIVIVQPKQPFPETDKWTIDQYIMHGGKVLWALDASNASLDSLMKGEENQIALDYPHNLNDLLFRYGVRINPNLILDYLNSCTVPVITGYIGNEPQTNFFPFPFLPMLVSQNQHAIVRNLNPVRSEFVSSIDTLENGIDKKILLTTSPYSRTTGIPTIINLDMLKEDLDPNTLQKKPIPVAVLLEGVFESNYRNRMAYGLEKISMPMKLQSEPTQMIVLSDGDLLKNRFNFEQPHPYPMGADTYTQQTFANKSFFVNCMNYMLDGSLLLDLRAKTIKLRLLDKQRIEQEKNKWLFVTLGLPVLLVIAGATGFTVYRRRKYRI